MIPKLEVGVFHDVWIYGALPIVVTDSRHLDFDQRDTPCTFGPDGPCINRTNSSTIADGILPMNGFDAGDPAVGFTDAGNPLIFRGPTRHGLDQVHLGLGWAPMNQRRDDTKPTWKLGAELRIAVGKPARLDRADPGHETGVGSGVDEVRLWTSIARRRGWAEPYVELWWQAPIANTKRLAVPGSRLRRPPHRQAAGGRGPLRLRGDRRRQAGRAPSASASTCRAGCSPTSRAAPTARCGRSSPTPATPPAAARWSSTATRSRPASRRCRTRASPTSRTTSRWAAPWRCAPRSGPSVHVAALGTITGETQHIISFTDAGVDLPTCSAPRPPAASRLQRARQPGHGRGQPAARPARSTSSATATARSARQHHRRRRGPGPVLIAAPGPGGRRRVVISSRSCVATDHGSRSPVGAACPSRPRSRAGSSAGAVHGRGREPPGRGAPLGRRLGQRARGWNARVGGPGRPGADVDPVVDRDGGRGGRGRDLGPEARLDLARRRRRGPARLADGDRADRVRTGRRSAVHRTGRRTVAVRSAQRRADQHPRARRRHAGGGDAAGGLRPGRRRRRTAPVPGAADPSRRASVDCSGGWRRREEPSRCSAASCRRARRAWP